MLDLLSTSVNYIEAALNVDAVRALRAISRADVPDMPDRIIAATARHLGIPLISRDPALGAAAGVTVIW